MRLHQLTFSNSSSQTHKQVSLAFWSLTSRSQTFPLLNISLTPIQPPTQMAPLLLAQTHPCWTTTTTCSATANNGAREFSVSLYKWSDSSLKWSVAAYHFSSFDSVRLPNDGWSVVSRHNEPFACGVFSFIAYRSILTLESGEFCVCVWYNVQ